MVAKAGRNGESAIADTTLGPEERRLSWAAASARAN
jgi:hypothetical protein